VASFLTWVFVLNLSFDFTSYFIIQVCLPSSVIAIAYHLPYELKITLEVEDLSSFIMVSPCQVIID
jgi:hypothetical protein